MPSARTRFAIFDTSIYIENFRTDRFTNRILDSPYVPRCSSIALHELMRGARTPREARFVDELRRRSRVVTPTEGQWIDGGRVLAAMRSREGYEATRLRAVAFDVLIALSAKGIGATLLTSDAGDFAVIGRYVDVPIVYWS
jgi:predicted nucleic acid-binding protein